MADSVMFPWKQVCFPFNFRQHGTYEFSDWKFPEWEWACGFFIFMLKIIDEFIRKISFNVKHVTYYWIKSDIYII